MENDNTVNIFRVNKNICLFSPSGKYLALALAQKLTIKHCATLENYLVYECSDSIEQVKWAPNSKYVLCANQSQCVIQVFSINAPTWHWKLTEGSAGFNRISWAPDSKSVLVSSDLNIRLSIWSLEDRSVTNIENLKSSVKNIAINGLSEKMAVIISCDGSDSVEIYKSNSWKLTRKLMCDKLYGIDGTSWSPNGELLGIWCSTIGKSRLLIYSTLTDAHIGAYSGDDNLMGRLEHTVRGIEKIVWCPSGQLLAVIGYNETVAIINHVTWSVIMQLYCGPVIQEGDYLGRVFDESNVTMRDRTNYPPYDHLQKYTMEVVNVRPINLTIDTKPSTWDLSIAQIDIFEFSPCGKYLALRHQLYPSTLWIWSILEDSVDHILTKNSISGIAWAPEKSRLLIFSSSSTIIEWQARKKACIFSSPQGMKVITGSWNPNGDFLTIHGFNKSSVIYMHS